MELYEAVGRRIHELRVSEGSGEISQITLEQLSSALSDFGVDIKRAALSNIERGIARPSLSMLLAIAAALGKLKEKPIQLRDFFPGKGTVEITPLWSSTGSQLQDFMNGHPVTSDLPISPKTSATSFSPSLRRATKRVNHLLNDWRDNAAPQQFDISADYLKQLITRRYGRTLDEEAIARATKSSKSRDDVTWQAKGRQTAKIIEELVREIDSTWCKKPYSHKNK
ncbi:MAG: helix-turn-helix domain-containing protein [Bifidobacterium crudilactis]|uniref:helix-turn-helix domain-containing protein n=1 Tax=Bifidobacterium crudilactis TaxID=327277 RepID=UPI003F9718E1